MRYIIYIINILCVNSFFHSTKTIIRNSNRNFNKTKKVYIIDIDNTIAYTQGNDYINSEPIQHRINYFNWLYNQGHEIHYWTGRGSLSNINYDQLTKDQLNDWKVLYDSLNIGKPHYDIWFDDKAINVKDIDIYISTNKFNNVHVSEQYIDCMINGYDGCEVLYY